MRREVRLEGMGHAGREVNGASGRREAHSSRQERKVPPHPPGARECFRLNMLFVNMLAKLRPGAAPDQPADAQQAGKVS